MRERTTAGAIAMCCFTACAPSAPELATYAVPASDQEPTIPWIAEDCLGDALEEELTLGIVFERQQDLSYDVDRGSHIAVWPDPEDEGASGRVALSSGFGEEEHVEGAKALCAAVTGNG